MVILLKIDSTHQDKNDEMDAVGLYSRRCHVNVTSFLMTLTLTLHHKFMLRIWKPYY